MFVAVSAILAFGASMASASHSGNNRIDASFTESANNYGGILEKPHWVPAPSYAWGGTYTLDGTVHLIGVQICWQDKHTFGWQLHGCNPDGSGNTGQVNSQDLWRKTSFTCSAKRSYKFYSDHTHHSAKKTNQGTVGRPCG